MSQKSTAAARRFAAAADCPRPEDTLGFLLNQLATEVRKRTDVALEPLSISPRTLGLLLVLAQQTGLSQIEVGRRLRMDRTTVSQVVDDLTRGGLIRREIASTDRRNHQLLLTPRGWSTVRQASVIIAEVEEACGAQALVLRVKRDLRRLLASVTDVQDVV